MSKVSFRTRQVDFNRLLPIVKYDSELLHELGEGSFINKGTPTLPSGMEREEENEHHFLEVLQALQLQKCSDISIPVPEIIDKSEDYEKVYTSNFILPKKYIHIRTVALDDDEPVEYDMDTDDEDWLRRSELNLSAEKFESMIDRLERGCGQRVMNLEEARFLLNDDPSLVISVYDYWLNKRVQCRQPLLLSVRQEKRDGGSNNDPYVAFRRRTERMQTRKNRKNDEYSYERMLLLREQMISLGEIVSRLMKRESTKRAIIDIERQIFHLRYTLGDWESIQVSEADVVAQKSNRSFERILSLKARKHYVSRKRKISRRSTEDGILESSDTSDMDGSQFSNTPFSFVRLPGCKYHRPLVDISVEKSENKLPFCLSQIGRGHHEFQHTGYMRRRLGRGGRVLFDRLLPPSDELDDYLQHLDSRLSSPETHKLSLPRITSVNSFVFRKDCNIDSTSTTSVSTATCSRFPLDCEGAHSKRLQASFLRKQPRHLLTLGLSRLTSGHRVGGRIYSNQLLPSSNTVHRSTVMFSSNQCLLAGTGCPIAARAAANTVDVENSDSHHQCGVDEPLAGLPCHVGTTPCDGGGSAVGKGRVAPLCGSAASILAATNMNVFAPDTNTPSSVLSKKSQMLNGNGGGTPVVSPPPKDDVNFSSTWLRNNSAPVKNSTMKEEGTVPHDTKKSIIQSFVYNV